MLGIHVHGDQWEQGPQLEDVLVNLLELLRSTRHKEVREEIILALSLRVQFMIF